jgi:hypothetical protein
MTWTETSADVPTAPYQLVGRVLGIVLRIRARDEGP